MTRNLIFTDGIATVDVSDIFSDVSFVIAQFCYISTGHIIYACHADGTTITIKASKRSDNSNTSSSGYIQAYIFIVGKFVE